MPDAIPKGMAVRAVTPITQVVPTQADKIPALSANREGKENKNAQEILGSPVTAKSKIRRVSISKENKRKKELRTINKKSKNLFFRMIFFKGVISIHLSKFESKCVSNYIKYKGNQKKS